MTMKTEFIECFDPVRLQDVRYSEGLPRLSPDISYASGNFSLLREKHSRLQLDSVNETNDRFETILRRTNWSPGYFKDKLILECGCGAGADTEILLKLGARVLSVDIAGVDIACRNIGENPRSQFLQASLLDLPLRKNYFDIVFCHRVLQHTPSPKLVLSNIIDYVKPNGGVFVHSYAQTAFQMLRWKYFLRPVTKRMPSEFLYRIINAGAPTLYSVSSALRRAGKVGRFFGYFFVPFINYRHVPAYRDKSDEWVLEYGVHDTFDALSPRYDRPLSANMFDLIARDVLTKKGIRYEIVEGKSITLLRSKSE